MFRYSYVYKGKLVKHSHEDRDALYAIVSKSLHENNINFSQQDLHRSIDRQSKVKQKNGKVTFSDAVNGAKALLRHATSNSVEYAEISRRSRICMKCPLRSQISMCGACGTAGKIANFITKFKQSIGVKASVDAEIQHSYCGVCSCSLGLMVVSHISSFHPDSGRPDECWLNPKSKNYIK